MIYHLNEDTYIIRMQAAQVYFASTVNNQWREDIIDATRFSTFNEALEVAIELGLSVDILELEPTLVLSYTPPVFDQLA